MPFKRTSGKYFINLLLGTALIAIPLVGHATIKIKSKIDEENLKIKKINETIAGYKLQIKRLEDVDSASPSVGRTFKKLTGIGPKDSSTADCRGKCNRVGATGLGCSDRDFKIAETVASNGSTTDLEGGSGSSRAPASDKWDNKDDPNLCEEIYEKHLEDDLKNEYDGKKYLDKKNLTTSCFKALLSCGTTHNLWRIQNLHVDINSAKNEIADIEKVVALLEKEKVDASGNCVDCHAQEMNTSNVIIGHSMMNAGGMNNHGCGGNSTQVGCNEVIVNQGCGGYNQVGCGNMVVNQGCVGNGCGGMMQGGGMMHGGGSYGAGSMYMGGMQMRQPSKGDYIVGGIQALMPALMGGLNLGAFAMEQNAYSNNYNQYLGFCQQVGVPCQQPGYMGGFGYMGGPLGGLGMGGMGMGMGMGGLGMGMAMGGMGMGMPMMGMGGMGGMGMAIGMALGGGMGMGMPMMGMGMPMMGMGMPMMGMAMGGMGMGMPMMGMGGMGMPGMQGMPGMMMGMGMPMMGMGGLGMAIGGGMGMPMMGMGGMGMPMMGMAMGGGMGMPMMGMGGMGMPMMGMAMGGGMGMPMMGMGGGMGMPMMGMGGMGMGMGYGNPQYQAIAQAQMQNQMMQPMYGMQNQQDLMLASQQAMQAQLRVGQIAQGGAYSPSIMGGMGGMGMGMPMMGGMGMQMGGMGMQMGGMGMQMGGMGMQMGGMGMQMGGMGMQMGGMGMQMGGMGMAPGGYNF